jgi:hypothetical protein
VVTIVVFSIVFGGLVTRNEYWSMDFVHDQLANVRTPSSSPSTAGCATDA